MPRIPTAGLNTAVAAAGMTPGTTYYLSAHSADPGTSGGRVQTFPADRPAYFSVRAQLA